MSAFLGEMILKSLPGKRAIPCLRSLIKTKMFENFSMTSGSSMLAMIFAWPPHFSHFSISMRMAAPLTHASTAAPRSLSRLWVGAHDLSLAHQLASPEPHTPAICCWERRHHETVSGSLVASAPMLRAPHELHRTEDHMAGAVAIGYPDATFL